MLDPLRPAIAVPPPRAPRRWPYVVAIVLASFVAGIGTHAIVDRPRARAPHPLSWDFLTRPIDCPDDETDPTPRDFHDLDGHRVRATCYGTHRHGSYSVLRNEGSDRRFYTNDDRCWRSGDVTCSSGTRFE